MHNNPKPIGQFQIKTESRILSLDCYAVAVWLTLILSCLVLFGGLGQTPLSSLNEARRALPVKAMLEHGDWLIPHIENSIYLAKPPLFYWLGLVSSKALGGISEWPIRLPSAIAAALTAFLIFSHAIKTYGRWSALFTVQVLIANVGFAMFARRAELEMLLTLLCVSSLLCAMAYFRGERGPSWIYASFLLLGLAMLTKGPVVLLLVILPLLVSAVITQDEKCWQVLKSPLGWSIFIIVGGWWYLAVSHKLGFHVWSEIVQRDLLEKMMGEGPKPWYSYLVWLLADFMPASLIALFSFRKVKGFFNGTAERWIIGMAILVPLVLFSIFSNKHDKYLLPVFPWIALVLGVALGNGFQSCKTWIKRVLIAAGLLMLSAYCIYYLMLEKHVYHYRYAVLQPFAEWSRSLDKTRLYAFRSIDSRLLYYAATPITVIDDTAIPHLGEDESLLLVEKRDAAQVLAQGYCPQGEFKPYLTRMNILYVMQCEKTPACRYGLDNAPVYTNRSHSIR